MRTRRSTSISFTAAELAALWEVGRFVLSRDLPDEPKTRAMRSALAKIRPHATEVICGGCGARPATKVGRCGACYMRERRRTGLDTPGAV